jgi:uncharacterized protein with von Willebrand factor type A (vWA) domain
MAMPHPGERILRRLAGFVATLRDNGYVVGGAETTDAARILSSALALRADTLRPALRALFCSNETQWRHFDEIFAAYWMERGVKRVMKIGGAVRRDGPRTLRQLSDSGAPKGEPEGADDPQRRADDGTRNPADGRGRHEGASHREALDRTDFRHMNDPDQMAAAQDAAAALARAMRTRLSRRDHASSRGRRLDLRATIRASVARGGVPLDRAYRRRRTQKLKLVVLLDASGSMSIYTAVFTRFIAGVIACFDEADAFLFHTRLVQISDALREVDPQRAIDRLSLLAEGVGGGTRIGACLDLFNRWHAKRVLTARSVVMIVSDGYDTGEPAQLGAAMRALSRRCRRIVWLNPMLGWPGYEPVARGMVEALPHIDLFAPAHNLESLRRLEPYLAKL